MQVSKLDKDSKKKKGLGREGLFQVILRASITLIPKPDREKKTQASVSYEYRQNLEQYANWIQQHIKRAENMTKLVLFGVMNWLCDDCYNCVIY